MGRRSDEVEDILGDLTDLAQAEENVSIGDVVEATGGRGFAPFIMIPALLEITPIGGIPGVPTFLAVIIALVTVQMVMGRDHLWFPGFIENRSVNGDKLKSGAEKLVPAAKWLDTHFGHRLEWAADRGAMRLVAVVVLVLCLMVPPLELLPFASTLPMAAIAVLGAALLLRDGLVTIVGVVVAGSVLVAGIWLVL